MKMTILIVLLALSGKTAMASEFTVTVDSIADADTISVNIQNGKSYNHGYVVATTDALERQFKNLFFEKSYCVTGAWLNGSVTDGQILARRMRLGSCP
jgi:hypothetical protein